MGNLNRRNGNKGVAHVLRPSVLRCVPNLRRLEILQLHLYRHTRRHITTARLQRHSLLVEVEICNGSFISEGRIAQRSFPGCDSFAAQLSVFRLSGALRCRFASAYRPRHRLFGSPQILWYVWRLSSSESRPSTRLASIAEAPGWCLTVMTSRRSLVSVFRI